jgi:hypothetical protein
VQIPVITGCAGNSEILPPEISNSCPNFALLNDAKILSPPSLLSSPFAMLPLDYLTASQDEIILK